MDCFRFPPGRLLVIIKSSRAYELSVNPCAPKHEYCLSMLKSFQDQSSSEIVPFLVQTFILCANRCSSPSWGMIENQISAGKNHLEQTVTGHKIKSNMSRQLAGLWRSDEIMIKYYIIYKTHKIACIKCSQRARHPFKNFTSITTFDTHKDS